MSSAATPVSAAEKASGPGAKWLALAAMMFAVSMMFIYQTIVSIAIPTIQTELGLSDGGVQWIVNGYLLALSAFIALGGRLSDIIGHKRMVLLGTVIFATSSALCGQLRTTVMPKHGSSCFGSPRELGQPSYSPLP